MSCISLISRELYSKELLLLLLEALYSQQQHSSKTKHCALINILKYNISTQKVSIS